MAVVRLLSLVGWGILLSLAAAWGGEAPATPPCVFDLPMLKLVHGVSEGEVAELFARGDYEKAADRLRKRLKRFPQDPSAHYNLACALARQGKADEAFKQLDEAIQLGFRDVKQIQGDEDLLSLRSDARFEPLLAQAAKPAEKPKTDWKYSIEPTSIQNGQIVVSEKNTAWNAQLNTFMPAFKIDKQATADKPVVEGYGKAGELVRAWYKEGTAAGNHGDLYDNRDGGHSYMNFKSFPQLTSIIYSEEAKKRQLHWGLQRWFLFGGITIGNSSTALTGGPMWRCQGRLALTEPGVPVLLYLQYVGRHLYLYPVHVDNNPGHNGANGQGHGDVASANTPYLILSQGSSGSDVVFLDALVATLAALRPEVKTKLAASGTLMSTLQMIFRMSNKTVAKPEDYLTGKAHPTAFEGSQVDAEKMVTLAHNLTADALPPMVQIQVLEEDPAVLGRDYFDIGPRQRLFDTPCAVARVVKSTKYQQRMVVSAEASKDLQGKPLAYHWVVLRGDESKIQIRKLNDVGSKAELIVDYQPRRPIAAGSPRESNRVDIGVFVHNGAHYSAPAFVCFYTLDNEARTYDDKHRIRTVDYTDPAVRDNYVDPLLDLRKDWRDEYRYADDGTLQGWTRTRSDRREEFTAEGRLILAKDKKGQPSKTCAVRYVAAPGSGGGSVLKQEVAERVPDDMAADSPVKFPPQGCLPAKYSPDQPAKDGRAPEPDYYLFSTPERSVKQIRQIQAEMPRGKFTPPKVDWTNLQRTRKLLVEGGPLHLVAVGDSIVNDTMRSGWMSLLEEAYPKAKIRGTVYVRGSGGCQHYKEQDRVGKVVVPLKPDLVFLGGISQKETDSMREVIHQLRKALPEVEILLASGAFGTTDPRDPEALAKAAHSGTGAWGESLKRLAAEEHCAYLDMTSPWAEYIVSSGLHPHRFYRDAVHANESGEQILAKILMAFFTTP